MSTPARPLADLSVSESACVEHVGGERSFRRRLMELGLVPGTRVELKAIAPLGDPLELLVRGASLSIPRGGAGPAPAAPAAPSPAKAAEPAARGALEASPVRGAQ